MQSFTEQGKKRLKATSYNSINGSVPLLRCLQPPLTILETTAKGATAVVAVDTGTKSLIAGKQSVSFGQTTATGGLLQSSPCAQPSKPTRLQGKKKNKRHTEGAQTGTLVSLQHDVCRCGPALLFQSPQHSLILQYNPFAQLASRAITVCTLGCGSAKK